MTKRGTSSPNVQEIRLTDPYLGCALLILGAKLLRLDQSNPDRYALIFTESEEARRIIRSYHDRTLTLPLKDVVKRYHRFKAEHRLMKNQRPARAS
jgi:hypothetical protein